jgi:hypothetical protein
MSNKMKRIILILMCICATNLLLTLILGENMPKILFLLLEFYILYFYGIIVIKKIII